MCVDSMYVCWLAVVARLVVLAGGDIGMARRRRKEGGRKKR